MFLQSDHASKFLQDAKANFNYITDVKDQLKFVNCCQREKKKGFNPLNSITPKYKIKSCNFLPLDVIK